MKGAFQVRYTEAARDDLYVALYEIQDAKTVNVLAVRHQREDDYH